MGGIFGQRETSKRKHRELLIIVLFLFAGFVFCTLTLILGVGNSAAEEFVPVSLSASNEGDYSADNRMYRFQRASFDLIMEVLLDREPQAEDIIPRATAIAYHLLTPVPTVTSMINSKSNANETTSTINITTAVLPTHTPIYNIPATPTPTIKHQPAQTATAKPVGVPIIWPTQTAPNSPAATSGPTKVPVISPSATSTASPTWTKLPSTAPVDTSTPPTATQAIPTNIAQTATITPSTIFTATAISTITPTSTGVYSSTITPSETSPSPGITPTSTSPTAVETMTSTPAPVGTTPFTSTPTETVPTSANTPTISPSSVFTATASQSVTPTPIDTMTPTSNPTNASPSATSSATITPSSMFTATTSPTHTPIPTDTATSIPTITTITPTYTPSNTPTATAVSPYTPTPTATPTDLPDCYVGTPSGSSPSDDAFIRASSPDSNFGYLPDIEVRPDNGANRRGLVRFDLSSIPQGISVTSATLYLYEKDRKLDQVTFIYKVTTPWNENSVTWNYPWLIPGGDFDNSHAYASFPPIQSNCMLTIDLTSLVQEWINGSPNYGFLLYSTGPNHILRYSSKENIAIGEHPKLHVSYIMPTLLSDSVDYQVAFPLTADDVKSREIRQLIYSREELFD